MSIWMTIGLLYALGGAVTSAWILWAMRRNEVMRRRHEKVAEVVGWPVVCFTDVVAWPAIVVAITLWGEPHE